MKRLLEEPLVMTAILLPRKELRRSSWSRRNVSYISERSARGTGDAHGAGDWSAPCDMATNRGQKLWISTARSEHHGTSWDASRTQVQEKFGGAQKCHQTLVTQAITEASQNLSVSLSW